MCKCANDVFRGAISADIAGTPNPLLAIIIYRPPHLHIGTSAHLHIHLYVCFNMDIKEIRWGIIGCGDVTEKKSGPAFGKVPNSSLVAVMRRDAAKAADYAKRHGVPRWYSDAVQLINDPGVNAIYIATPPLFHEQYAIAALKAGKPVYLEKPMTMDAAAARRIEEAVHQTGVPLTVAHYRRQQPYFLKIRELIGGGVIGKVLLANLRLLQPHRSSMIAETEIPWRLDPSISGGGLFHDLAPHQLDLMLYFFGPWKRAVGQSANTAGLYAADDSTAGTILFESGMVFNGLWSFVVPEQERMDTCELIGTKGSIRFGIFDQKNIKLLSGNEVRSFSFDPLEHVQQPMIERVVQYFRGEVPNPCPVEDGVSVMQMMDAFTKPAQR